MTDILTSDQLTRIKAWTQDVVPAFPLPLPELPDSRTSQPTVGKRRTRAPLVSTSANIRKRKCDQPDPDPAPTNIKSPKRGPANERSQKPAAQPRTTVTRRRSAVPVKRRGDTMADRYPIRDRKPTVKAREELEAEQRKAEQRDWEETEGRYAQSRPPLGYHPPPFTPPPPPPRTPKAKSHGDPLRLNSAVRLTPSDLASFSNADNRSRPVLSPTRGTSSPSKDSTSPTRKSREMTMEQQKSDKSLTVNDLRTFTPSIVMLTVSQVFAMSRFQKGLPTRVDHLRLTLKKHTRFVPRVLEQQYLQEFDTPRKTRDQVPPEAFQDSFAASPKDADMLREVAASVLEDASFNAMNEAHERQWSSTTVSSLINAVKMKYRGVQSLNVCAISPVELRPRRKNGEPVYAEGESSAASQTTNRSTATSTSRMIDLAMGLRLSSDEQSIIYQWLNPLLGGEKSLNQTLSYARYVPLFLDIELKKALTERQAEFQLGIWQAAGFAKRSHHGWNQELMPMLGICINGHQWNYYITFPESRESNATIIMMEMGSMGHTHNIFGVWEIMFKLDLMLKWGTTEYKAWFDRVVMGQARAEIERRDQASQGTGPH